MRHLSAAWGLAAAAYCCWLLFSGVASASRASDSITVSGVAQGASIQFTVTSSPLKQISFFSGGWQFTRISSAGGVCGQTVDGGFCNFYTTPVTSFVVDATISGGLPTRVAGGVTYGDTSTGTFMAPITFVAPGKPSLNGASFSGMKDLHPHLGYRLHRGMNAPEIKGFTLRLPHGLSVSSSTPLFSKHWDGRGWKCRRDSKQMLGCHTTTPVAMTNVTIGNRTLDESQAFYRHIIDDLLTTSPIIVVIKDAHGHTTNLEVTVPIKN